MNTLSIPNYLSEPPPEARHDFALDLLDGERLVGWLRPDAIGFTGFANANEAAHAAWVAYRTLQRRLARRDHRRPVPIDTEPLRLVAENNGRIIVGSRDRVAKLVEPDVADAQENGFGFELRLDSPMDEVSMRAKAYRIYRTMRRSGVRWSMWRPAPALAPARAAAVVADGTVAESFIEHSLELRALALGVLLIAAAVVAFIVPGDIATMVALISIAGLILLRLTMLRAGWPQRWARRAPPELPDHATT
jgi:hypothetical protein